MRRYQMIHTYTFDRNGKEQTERSSFKHIEKAIESAEMFINKSEPWIDVTTKAIEIIDKETGEAVWKY